MKKILFCCLMAGAFLCSHAINKVVVKPYVEGKGMRGWLVDSIQITDTATIVYGQYGLGKGDRSWGSLENYIEDPATGKKYKQTGIRTLPLAPDFVVGSGKKEYFQFIFQAIDPTTKVINITSADFSGKGAAWYGLWLAPRTTVFTKQLAALPNLEGNWYATNGKGSWKVGFYEKKIFWNNQFWDYKVLTSAANVASLELSKSKTMKTTLQVRLKPNATITIVANGKTLNLSKKMTFNVIDNSMFNNTYTKSDSLTVSGYYQVANPLFSKKVALLVPQVISDLPHAYPLEVGADGTFNVRIPFNHVAKVTFSNQLGPQSPLSEVSFIAEPGNHIFISYRNEDEKGVVFGGDNERVNNEYQVFSLAHPYFPTARNLSDNLNDGWGSFFGWRKDQSEKASKAYASWQTTHPVNVKLDTYMQLYLKYAMISDLTKGAAKSGVTPEQIDFLPLMSDATFYNNPDAVLLPEYGDLITGLSTLQRNAVRLKTPEILAYIKQYASPTSSENALLQRYNDVQSNINSNENYEIYKTFMNENRARIDSIYEKYKSVISKLFTSKSEGANKKYGLPKGFSEDLSTIRKYGNTIANEDVVLRPIDISYLTEKIKTQELLSQLLQRNTEVEAAVSIIKNAKLPDGVNTYVLPEDTKDLTAAIVEKYKGKVVYVDFWATWCGPCKAEMPYSEKRKVDFKGKDVVFVYITGASSPELTWKKMISGMTGEHFKLSEAQWKSIGTQYKIDGIPRYMLIDKNGQIVEMNAPRPSSEKEFSEAVNKLLD